MITPALKNFVTNMRAQGTSEELLRQALVSRGWSPADIATVITMTRPEGRPIAKAARVKSVSLGWWNWGAAMLTWIWGIRFKVHLAWLVWLIPGWPVVLGVMGNRWAWKANPWPSEAEFNKVQHDWNIAGVMLLGYLIVIGAISAWMLFGRS